MLNLLLALKFLACTPIQPLGVRFFSIPTRSMEPTLKPGSIVEVDRCAYGLSRFSYDWFELPLNGRWPSIVPARGDIVVFRLPTDPSVFWVKRVIGLPGDRIALRDGRVLLDGTPVTRRAAGAARFVETMPGGGSYAIELPGGADAPLRTVMQVRVPPGQLYVIGDNRDDSLDSRVGAVTGWNATGTVPIDHVFGRVEGTGFWPLDLLKPVAEALLGTSQPP